MAAKREGRGGRRGAMAAATAAASRAAPAEPASEEAQAAAAREEAREEARQEAHEEARRARSDSGEAFLPDPEDGAPAQTPDDLAETLAEDFVRSATSGENADDELLDVFVPEEIGGPFVETTASEEFADDTDPSNPEDTPPEPLPRAVPGLAQGPREPE